MVINSSKFPHCCPSGSSSQAKYDAGDRVQLPRFNLAQAFLFPRLQTILQWAMFPSLHKPFPVTADDAVFRVLTGAETDDFGTLLGACSVVSPYN